MQNILWQCTNWLSYGTWTKESSFKRGTLFFGNMSLDILSSVIETGNSLDLRVVG